MALFAVKVIALPAQTPSSFTNFNPHFEVFTLPGGILGNSVQSIVQDSVGFLWFASQDGLHRFDGQNFRTFRHDHTDLNSLSSNYCEYLFLDSRGIFWITHYTDGGLTTFDPATETFTRYRHDPRDPHSLSHNTNAVVAEDRDSFIWVGGDGGVDRLDPKTGKFRHFRYDPNNPHSLSHDQVRGLYVDKQGTLWVATGFPWDTDQTTGGLNRYNPKTESFTRYLHDPKDTNSLIHNKVRAMLEDSRGNFWVGTAGDGLHLMNREKGTFTRLTYDAKNPTKPTLPYLKHHTLIYDWAGDNHVSSIFEDRDGRIWITGFPGGLNVFDPEDSGQAPTSGITRHFEAGKKEGDLTTNRLWSTFQTKDGVLWLCSGRGGAAVFRVRIPDERFSFDSYQQAGVPSADQVTSVAKDSAGNVWLGFFGGDVPLCRWDRKTGKTFPVMRSDASGGFSAKQVSCLSFDREGGMWIGTERGLFRRDPQTGQFRRYLSDLADTWFSNTVQDTEGFIWTPDWNAGLIKLDPTTGTYVSFRHDPKLGTSPRNVGGQEPQGVYLDAAGKVWVSGGGWNDLAHPLFLDRFDAGELTFTHFIKEKETGIGTNITQDEQGNIWFVDNLSSLQKLNPADGSRQKFNPNGVRLSRAEGTGAVSFAKDNDGRFWLFCDGKLFEFDPKTEQFYTYGEASGVRPVGNQYSNLFVATDGEILIAGELGLLSFYPEKIPLAKNNCPPDVRITSFRLLNQQILPGTGSVLEKPIWQTSDLRLAHDQNVFAFSVASFNFLDSTARQVEFMLEGYDRLGWRNDLRDGETPPYVNVPPGDYTFRVRGADNHGVWNMEGVSLKIKILPPWWHTWWAWSLYAALAFGGIFFLYRMQLNRRLAQAETLRLQELDQVKTKLYTNITHEFRTPLTIILGMAQQALDNPKDYFRHGLTMIIRNGRNLLGLVNQMLDLSKLESGKLSLQYRQGDVVNFLKYLFESFHSLAESKGVQLHFLSDLEALQMDFDAERLQQVMSNLLSNAVKFTQAGGHIYLEVRGISTAANSGFSTLFLKVKDTGMGIPEAHLPHIFDRFYQVDDTPTRHGEGTGIGLALTKELVKLMEGEISVKSQLGRGSEFTLTLPVRNDGTGLWSPEEGYFQTKESEPALPFEDSTPLSFPKKTQIEKPLVLIADDNADVLAYLSACLAGDYRLVVAKDGRECVDTALEAIPDLIVTDVMMPQLDGFEVCRVLKNEERTSHIPIIMLTAKADLDSKIEGLERGADAYLVKPFHQKELLTQAKTLLDLRQKLQRYYRSLAGLENGEPAAAIPPKPEVTEDYFLRKVRRVVEAHLDDYTFNVEQLCREVSISHSQLHRKLSALTGISANKFIRSIRLNKAKELLVKPELSITSVALDAGFSDASYFGKIFKQEFGMTPMEWREAYGEKNY